MNIIIDTREQAPLNFSKMENVSKVITRKLDVGDYAVEYNNGYVANVVFERKGMGDAFGTMGKGYKRFKREIERAEAMGVKLILIIEGSMTKVLNGYKYSKIKGKSLNQKLFTLLFRYNIETVYCTNRLEMTKYIVSYYNGIGRKILYDQRQGSVTIHRSIPLYSELPCLTKKGER